MRKVLPAGLLITAEPQPGFVDERGGLERVPSGFTRHAMRRQPPQFVIDERQQFADRRGIARPGALKDQRNVAHVGNRWTG